MAQTQSFTPLHQPLGVNQQHPNISGSSGFVVIDQQPSRTERFPYTLKLNWILGFSIAKCVLGGLLLIIGIVNVATVDYETKIAFGVWCGLTILANGIIGCILKYKQNKCLIATFLGLSITSLIFDITMLSFYAVVLDYFINVNRYICSYYYNSGYTCYKVFSGDVRDLGIGIAAFLMSMVLCELGCSIGSVVVSCKAYSKCCNTCNANDCCTCLGCCECDCYPLNASQVPRPNAPPAYNYQNIQMSSMQPGPLQYNPNQPLLGTNVQAPSTHNAQPAYNNPCSGLVSFVINMPSYFFGGPNGAPLSAINVTVQPVPSNQQVPASEPARNVEQLQTAIADGAQQNLPRSTWEQVDA